jgi:hypothetical protein
LGATIYDGIGPGRCNCSFTTPYPYAIGPRLGAAYQIDRQTVLRAGWGVTYGGTTNINHITDARIIGVGWNQLQFSTSIYGDAALVLKNGLQYDPAQLTSASLDPGIRPSPGQINAPPYYLDRNGGRPSRINQWSVGLQREITRDLLVEAAYVGNRGVWFQANDLLDLNALTPERIRAAGLDINNAADRALLVSPLNSSTAQARGFAAPYPAFPAGLTVAQSLRPFPQFGTIPVRWAPLGSTWYDSLQTKATKRYSHGLDFTAAFTWQKELNEGAQDGLAASVPVNDVFNRKLQKYISGSSQPFTFVTAFTYRIPAWERSRVLKGWTIAGMLRYASGLPIEVPLAQNQLSSLLFRGTLANRVAGQPLFLKDLNCHCIDPNKDFVLNPKAWSDPAPGQWGTSAAFYNDYRYARRPNEQLSLSRSFRLREGMSLTLRAEFFNVFNRTYLNNPDSTNALATQSTGAGGVPISGFGRIDAGSLYNPPRTGQLVARFRF